LGKLKEVFNFFLSYKNGIYIRPIEKIVFRFRFLESDLAPKNSIFKNPTYLERNEDLLPPYFLNLPYNRFYETWGDELIINGDNTYVVNQDYYSFIITQFEDEYHVLLKDDGEELFNFYDVYYSDDGSNNTLMRTVGSYKLYYFNNMYHTIKQL
jgi:hypothetical protein